MYHLLLASLSLRGGSKNNNNNNMQRLPSHGVQFYRLFNVELTK